MKKALLIGINYKNTENQLNGCINDVVQIKELLMRQFSYREENITFITDETDVKPTKNVILSQLKKLVDNSKNCEEIWIHYSGHGSYVPDYSGDELDGKDEALVPLDFNSAGFILDDDIKGILKSMDEGCRCMIIFDCCHSGTAADLLYVYKDNIESKEKPDVKNLVKADIMLLSGCRDDQTSADALINKRWAGALTSVFLEILKENKYSIKVLDLVAKLRERLKVNGYSQYPVLSSSREVNPNRYFSVMYKPMIV
jgi:hypothetical protein